VRCARLEKGADFLTQVLMEGGNVSVRTLVQTRGQEINTCFKSSPLARAAEIGAQLAQPGGAPLTAFERECDNVLMAYQADCRRCPFGEQVVVGYLYAKEAELTASRTVMAGRMAGLAGDVIRQRLRATYI
jgi:V/A-type H+-transporting ATPase subunit C